MQILTVIYLVMIGGCKVKEFFKRYIEDVLIILGALVAIVNTYFLNVYIANYLLAAVLIGFGIIIARRYKK